MDYSSILSKPKSFFGKQKVWMARGEDLALFNTHRPNIQNLLRHSCIPESSHNLWIGLYRIGITEDEAKTFVVVSCTDRRIRKLTRDILNSCPIFQPGQALDRFKVISKATLPETACEPRQTMQNEQNLENEMGLQKGDEGKNIAKDEYKTIRISPSITGDSYLCRQVQARQVSGKGEVRFQTATAGPLISLDGRTYQLTVAHVVNFQEKNIYNVTESTTDDWDDWDDESDDNTDSSCSVDEDVASWDISAGHNSTSASDVVSDDEVPESLSSNSALEVTTQQTESGTAIAEATSPDEEPIDESVHPPSSPHLHLSERPVHEEFLIDHASSYLGFAPGSENCQISTELDYLLIPISEDLQAGVCQTDPRPIIIATASLGYMEGVVFPASSLLRPPGSRNFQTLYCIESGNSMPKGTSGSAVFDKRTGLLAGYIVLGCPEKNMWYMVPILDVLNDLENLSPGSPDNTTDTLNCLYIKNPNPTAITALLKTPSRLPMKGFQEIFYNSITTQPHTIIDLNQDTWLESPCFSIAITLPYVAISVLNHDESDMRSVAAGNAFRSRFELSFLNTQRHSCGTQDGITAPHTDKDHPYMATWSMVVIGVSERNWTAVHVDDDFFDEEEPTADDSSEDSILADSSLEDHTANAKRSTSPRAYALRALAMSLEKIAGYHEQAQLRFATDLKTIVEKWNGLTDEHLSKDEQLCTVPFSNVLEAVIRLNSKLIERVDNFLSKDLHRSPEDELRNSLWESVYQEPGASESLQRIRNSLSMIRDTQSRLKILNARAERQNAPALIKRLLQQ
ncbi:hypothetical protein FACUT_10901 [Fusarium acutatum]|uniref:Uncharacterized protein n=1 Tax=Fusarium acutatum TaxID=78861 RepID=A0A8H4JH58_9HYPO|nr:hypothetical protein FACUT_10901 [Fusarium acutatum]